MKPLFFPLDPKQAEALGRVARTKAARQRRKLIIGIEEGNNPDKHKIIVVGPSPRDDWRRDITPGGKIKKVKR